MPLDLLSVPLPSHASRRWRIGTHSSPRPFAGPRAWSIGKVLAFALSTIPLCQCGGGSGGGASTPAPTPPPPPPTNTQPTVSIGNASAEEGEAVVFTVSLSKSSTTSVTTTFNTANGSAVAPGDYTAQSGVTVTVPAGSTSATVSVPTIENTAYTGSKTFTATIGNPAGATLGTASATGTILDDETPPEPPPPPPPAGQDALVIDTSYVDLNSTAFSRFRAWVDSGVTGTPGYGYSAYDPAFMALLVNDPKYCTLAVRLADAQVAAAESAIAAGNAPQVAHDSYLEVGPMIADVAITLHACPTYVDQTKRSRWSAYAEQAVWNVWHHTEASWGGRPFSWTGWSTDNPGNNYYYSFLEATMYWGLVVNSSTWLDELRLRRLPPLREYFAALPGGGSREGTGYGTSHMRLFGVYRLWRDSTGEDLANASPHATDSISYWIHATVPTLDRFAPIGDQSRDREANLYDYQRRLMLEARKLTTNAQAYAISSWWLNNISVASMSSSFNRRYDLLPAGTGGNPPTDLIYHARGVGHFFARTGWDRAAMWMSIVAGPYNESHAHQDQGSFSLYANGWLAVTANIESPSNGINQGTDVHNLVRFVRNGTVARQCESTTRASTLTVTPGSGGAFTANADLTPAFCDNTTVTSWTRQFTFGSRKLTIRDQFAVAAGTTATFQVNTPALPVLVNSREATAGRLRVRVLEPANATINSNFSSGKYVESGGGYRIDVTGGTSGYLVELSEVQ